VTGKLVVGQTGAERCQSLTFITELPQVAIAEEGAVRAPRAMERSARWGTARTVAPTAHAAPLPY